MEAGKSVLYLDDDEVLLDLFGRVLKRAGHRMAGYAEPQAALAALRAEAGAFDVVLTDHNMPAMTGLEFARAVHAIRPDLPVLLISGWVTEDVRAEAAAAGIREVVPKREAAQRLPDILRGL